MPELPEVETIVRDLKKKVLKRTFISVWTDFQKMIGLCFLDAEGQVKKTKNLSRFKKEIKGRKIQKIWRRGKNIFFDLSGGKTLLVHQKLTGHLLFGRWKKREGIWKAIVKGPLSEDPMNKFLHLIFLLDDGNMLAMSDLRKFAKIELWDKKGLEGSEYLNNLGAEPLDNKFTFKKFKEVLRKKRGKIKQVLMDQSVIAGIGNIYSDEILWESKVHPIKNTAELEEPDFKKIYLAMRKILKKAVQLRGESFSDFRDLEGKKGFFDEYKKVYRKKGQKCSRCGAVIERIKLGGRSAHYCPKCQSPIRRN